MKERVLEILSGVCPDVDFTMDADLVDDGVLDSLSIVTIISALSTEFSIQLPLEELVPENFNSLDAIVELLEKYVK